MRVIGTAGHVDHGKSTLVRALTGIDPDRLTEEKSRGMTIDLGFAWFDLVLPPYNLSEPVGIVDVPGHIDFIKNMLAGVGGIDAALLVIAADEGVMPQTREHLDILDLLAVPSLIVALTKIDVVDEAEWLDLVELDIADLLQTTQYAEAPIVRISPVSGEGMDLLQTALAEALAELPARRNREKPRLPIDRVFSLSGFGTIVTGTMSDGRFETGDAVEVLPAGVSARIRGMQSHKQQVQRGEPGSRLAVNLSGVGSEELSRGDVVVHPDTLRPTNLIDVSFRMLPSAPKPLRHNAAVNLFVGAAETPARVRLLGERQLEPGRDGWLQLRLERSLVAAPGDRYILRQPSPSRTLGGGAVVDAHPRRKWRRYDARVVARMQTLAAGAPDEIILDTLAGQALQSQGELVARSGLDVRDAEEAISELVRTGAVIVLGAAPQSVLLTVARFEQAVSLLEMIVAAYHAEYPLRRGMPKSELRSRFQDGFGVETTVRAFNLFIQSAQGEERIDSDDNSVWQKDFRIQLSGSQQARIEQTMKTLEDAGFSPPSQGDLVGLLGGDERLLDMLLDEGRLVRTGGGIVYRREDFERMTDAVRTHIEENGSISLAETRDLFGTSRKYAQAVLEELDMRRITRREGDVRLLRDRERPQV